MYIYIYIHIYIYTYIYIYIYTHTFSGSLFPAPSGAADCLRPSALSALDDMFCLRRLRDEQVPTRSPIALAQFQTIHVRHSSALDDILCIYVYIHTYIYTHIHVHILLFTYIVVHMCVYIYIYIY